MCCRWGTYLLGYVIVAVCVLQVGYVFVGICHDSNYKFPLQLRGCNLHHNDIRVIKSKSGDGHNKDGVLLKLHF